VDGALIRAESDDPRRLDIRVLGGLQVELDGTPLEVTGQRRLCILAVLLLNQGRTVSRADLAAWAWSEDAPATVERQITNYVSALRGMLAPAGDRIRLLARHPGFTAVVEAGALDVDRFAELVGQARTARAGQEFDLAADRLREALGLWRGNPFDGLETPYLRRRARILEQDRRDAALLLAEIHLEAGTPAQAVVVLRELAAQQPLEDEAVALALIRALTGAGQPADAADVAVRVQRRLDEQGRAPTPAFRQAHSDALAGRVPQIAVRRTGPRYQLPTDTGAFTGREQELAELVRTAKQAEAGQSRGAVVICALDGMAGVGKTALAIHAAHAVAERFPDGQLFLCMHGYTDGMAARDPADALASALQSLGVAPQQIPEDLDARAALYRDRLAGTRTLVLLDNASSEAQVRPLLPANDRCLVLVTSRKRFKALDDAILLPLDVLPLFDALALFRQVAGPDRVPPNDPVLEMIVELCGRLPLALRIAAAILRHRRAWTLEHLAQRLSAAPSSLDPFFDGDRNLATIFDLSYRSLTEPQQFVFRTLGLIPGTDIDAYAAAALLDRNLDEAEQLLQDLVDHNLVVEAVAGRYRMHDLIRAQARTLAGEDPAEDRDAALVRLLEYYQHTAARADGLLDRHTRPEASGRPPAHSPALTRADEARKWLRGERANIEDCLRFAIERGWHGLMFSVSAAMGGLLRMDGPWSTALHLYADTAATAQRLGDRGARARALTELGQTRESMGDYLHAVGELEEAAKLCRETGDARGEAQALTNLGEIRWLTGDYTGASSDLQQALQKFRALGNRLGEATALTDYAMVRRGAGDFAAAEAGLRQAYVLYRDLADLDGQGTALSFLAQIQTATGQYQDAFEGLREALDLFRELGHKIGEANTLLMLGELKVEAGDALSAAHDLEAALEMYLDLGDRNGHGNALSILGEVRSAAGDHEAAIRSLRTALDLFREAGARGNEAEALVRYAAALRVTGEMSDALSTYHEALSLSREINQPEAEARALEGIGESLLLQGEAEAQQAATWFAQALDVYQRLAKHKDAERIQARLAAAG
jgi:DNA-binding SARP family transcriptional activator